MLMTNHSLAHFTAWIVVVAVIALIILAFEIWMIIDAALSKHLSDKAKAWWIGGMLLVHPFVAIAYFFTDRRKNK